MTLAWSNTGWRCVKGAALLLILAALLRPVGGTAQQSPVQAPAETPVETPAPWPLVIRFASEGANPPFTQVDANGALQGFEIELARQLCEVMKASCSFAVQDWEGLVPDLRAGRIDAIVSSLEITEERRQRIAFTRALYHRPAAFMAARDAQVPDLSPKGLAGRRLGAVEGSVYDTYLQDRYSAASTVLRYASQDEANLDLALGRVDLVLGDKITLADWLRRGREADCCGLAGDAPRDEEAFGEGFGIGLRRHDDRLRLALDDAIAAIQADGTYDRVRARFFPFDLK